MDDIENPSPPSDASAPSMDAGQPPSMPDAFAAPFTGPDGIGHAKVGGLSDQIERLQERLNQDLEAHRERLTQEIEGFQQELQRETESLRERVGSTESSTSPFPPPPGATSAVEADPFAEAGSQLAELMRRFVEDMGGMRRDTRDALDSAGAALADAERVNEEAVRLRTEAENHAGSARALLADAERVMQEAMRLHSDAEAEADRVVDTARAEASSVREDAEARAAETDRLVHRIVDDIVRAQQTLSEAVDSFAAIVGEPSKDVVVIPEATGNPSAA